jgi:hypothetical protein
MRRALAHLEPSLRVPTTAAIARVARERENATNSYLRDRDVRAREATMSPLDVEQRDAMREPVVDSVPPAEAVRYLRELRSTWEAADGGAGRQMLAEALFKRIDPRGFRDVTVHLTDEAIAKGFGAILPERPAISLSGRGETVVTNSNGIVRILTITGGKG